MDAKDQVLLYYADKFARNAQVNITIYDPNGLAKSRGEMRENVRQMEKEFPDLLQVVTGAVPRGSLLDEQDLMLVGLESWKKLLEQQTAWLNMAPSTLILRK
jgi:hypothetical protein